MPRRTAAGTDYNRVNLLMAVLEKRLGMALSNSDAYVNIAGGIRMNEPAIDLGIVMALVSSYRNRPVDEKTIVFGLTGTGYFDMTAYSNYNSGNMVDHIPTDEDLEAGFATLERKSGDDRSFLLQPAACR